jgi:protein-S-isoprenylcysteine O-methyltransferase Ste14
MEIKNTAVSSFLKSFVFSLLLCLFWGFFTFNDLRAVLKGFDFVELLWLIYNATITLLFLIRTRPSVVSMNPVHWVVALVTSFSGFFFFRVEASQNAVLSFTAESFIIFALFLAIFSSFILGRNYDFLPALRGVKTRYLYGIIRHPMYLSSIIIKLGYILKNPSVYNILLFAVIIVLYDKRARYEEGIMANSNVYADYLQKVKYRFIPGIY